MAARRRTYENSSLELLLDTITNAFGGILFLAILIVILLQATGRRVSPSKETVEPNIAELAARLKELEAELSTNELEIKAVEAISRNLASPGLKARLAQLREQRTNRNELAAEKTRRLQGMANTQERLDSIKAKTQGLTRDISTTKEALEVFRSNLDQEQAKRTIKSPFPEERSTHKIDFSVTMRYGRWYVDRSSAGLPNLVDFAVLDAEGEYLTVTPKPYRGIPVVENELLSNRIRESLNSKDPHSVYVAISIWDDSYEQFQVVRDFLVENGFDYRLIPVTDGDEIVEGYVPDPQVQ